MGFFGLFNNKDKKVEKKSRVPAYDAKLISKFHKDHEGLVEQIGKIQEEMNKVHPDSAKIKKLLKSLRMQLLGHFMEEDIKLYWYLKDYYKDEAASFSVVKQFEESIKGIQKEVMRFFDYYSLDKTELDREFEIKFEDIVTELSARIASEESNLYTLYTK